MSISKQIGVSEQPVLPKGARGAARWMLAGVIVMIVAASYMTLPPGPAEGTGSNEKETLKGLRDSVSELLVRVAELDATQGGASTQLIGPTLAIARAMSAAFEADARWGEVRSAWELGVRPALERLSGGIDDKGSAAPQARDSARQRGETTRQLLAMLAAIEQAQVTFAEANTPLLDRNMYVAVGLSLAIALVLIVATRLRRVRPDNEDGVAEPRKASSPDLGAGPQAIQTGIAREVLRAVFDEPETGEPFRELLREIERALAASATAIIATNPDGGPAEVLATSTEPADEQFASLVESEDKLHVIDGSDRLFWIAGDTDQESPAVAATLTAQGETLGVLIVRSPLFSAPPGSWQGQLLKAAEEVSGIVSGVQRARLNRRLVISEERAAIARELHDSLAQSLSYLKIQASRLQKLLEGRTSTTDLRRLEVDTIVEEFRSNLTLAYRQLRELITTCRLTMNGRDLGQALEDSVEEFGRRSAVTIDLDNRVDGIRLAVDQELQVLHIVREALSNIVRHAHAKHAVVTLRPIGGSDIELAVFDDGVGLGARQRQEQHYGLVIMQERARNLGGAMRLDTPVDGGTRISVKFSRCSSPRPAALV